VVLGVQRDRLLGVDHGLEIAPLETKPGGRWSMKLESVRDLKAELSSGLHEAAVAESFAVLGAMRTEQSAAARRRTRSAKVQLPGGVVLGISPGRGKRKDGHKLAVRFQAQTEDAVRFGHYVTGKVGSEVEIQYIGAIQVAKKPAEPTSRYHGKVRPLESGYSIGHFSITAGTLGGFVRDGKTGRLGLLSNNHVLGAVNAAKKGDDILQQGPVDEGKRPGDVVGSFAALIKLLPKGNRVDAAWALADPKCTDAKRIADYAGRRRGALVKADDILKSESVWKLGRTTGLTKGTITAVELDHVSVGYPDLGVAVFDSQIEVMGTSGPFSLPGDSGAFIFNDDNCPLGLLFGGSTAGGPNKSGRTYASPLETVLELLKLELA
jgi:hypothetical protein